LPTASPQRPNYSSPFSAASPFRDSCCSVRTAARSCLPFPDRPTAPEQRALSAQSFASAMGCAVYRVPIGPAQLPMRRHRRPCDQPNATSASSSTVNPRELHWSRRSLSDSNSGR